MDDETWTAMVNALVAGAIHGIKLARDDLDRNEPGTFPPIDDAVMFDVAVLFTASLIEANPEYQDPKRFSKAADMVADHVKDRLRFVRAQSDAMGAKLLYKQIEAATGVGLPANDRY